MYKYTEPLHFDFDRIGTASVAEGITLELALRSNFTNVDENTAEEYLLGA